VRALVYFQARNAPNNRRASEPLWSIDPKGLGALLAP
jgi:hypothetical protein